MAVYYVVQTVAGSPLCLVNPPSGRLKNEGLETPSIPTHPSDLDTSGIARSKRNEENEEDVEDVEDEEDEEGATARMLQEAAPSTKQGRWAGLPSSSLLR